MQAKTNSFIAVLVIILCLAVVIALSVGSTTLNLLELLKPHNQQQFEIVLKLRLPRVLNAITVGALLSIAGLLIQNLVKNPLADPYILGVSGASAVAQLMLIALGISLPFWLFSTIGFIAALFSLLLLLVIATKKSVNTNNLLLTGVVLAFAYGALISLILTISPMASTKPMLYWLMGDLSHTSFPYFSLLVLAI
ncbi:MAG TPA: iron ABC transporter permease, partial [Oceanospirillales bacterium]|nr:iron ABC transporter permease [Oceanospirillales bacterium]